MAYEYELKVAPTDIVGLDCDKTLILVRKGFDSEGFGSSDWMIIDYQHVLRHENYEECYNKIGANIRTLSILQALDDIKERANKEKS